MCSPQKSLPSTFTVKEFLRYNANSALDLQRSDGSFPPSQNGVYNEPETPVRTTSHWLTILSEVYENTEEEIYATAANDAADYLLNAEVRPHGYTFKSRNTESLDYCDGLVGQSGPIRGLARAGSKLDRPDLVETAKKVFDLHPFSDDIGLWERVEIDGNRLSFDRTLNHQVIFAAAASELVDTYPIVRKRVDRFLDCLSSNMKLRKDGCIRHYIHPPTPTVLRIVMREPRCWNLLWNNIVFNYYTHSTERKHKEIGYFPLIFGRLAILNQVFPDHNFWKSNKFKQAREFLNHEEYQRQLKREVSKFGSMAPEFDHVLALNTFNDVSLTELSRWIGRCIERNYDPTTGLLTKRSVDPMMQSTLIISLTNLVDMEIIN